MKSHGKPLTEDIALASNIGIEEERTCIVAHHPVALPITGQSGEESMRRFSPQSIIALILMWSVGFCPQSAEAGPLLEWLFGRRQPQAAYPVGQPVPMGNGTYQSNYGSYYSPYQYGPQYTANYGSAGVAYGSAGSGYGSAGYAAPTAPAAAPNGLSYGAPSVYPPTANYVPNFRTQAYRAPVTYYRPLLTTDPRTGAQVVQMAPCTSYEYQAARVPAYGRRALFGSTVTPYAQPAPAAVPTYSLPQSGIPLAGNTVYPHSMSYGTYGALQPSTTAPSNYPTAPYYGAPSGGCTGSTGYYPAPTTSYPAPANQYSAPAVTPGLVAPQSPSGTYRTPAETYGQPTTPPTGSSNGLSAPPANGVYPEGSDPAGNVRPSLPRSGARLETGGSNLAMQPINRAHTAQQSVTSASGQADVRRPSFPVAPNFSDNAPTNIERSNTEPPSLAPIPIPDDMEIQPKWSPGLLRDGDMTAFRPIDEEAIRFAGQAKPIHWASFTQRSDHVSRKQPTNFVDDRQRLRAITPMPTSSNYQAIQRTAPSQTRYVPPTPQPQSEYDSRGWQRTRK